ncbi:MAG: pyridoxamine 5'-phosphate oxidase family protein [Gammaproteobacteria bacterium]|nr:MAG: pyridoxamine 5'-phosphate oxidase family protein [Gammaproteobacteria bacterium]
MSHQITTISQLTSIYDTPGEASIKKEIPYLHPHYQAIINASPFAVLATRGLGGLDASPRGDAAGFVHIEDDKTLIMPDRRGNNRLDSLRNIIHDPQIALLFLVPGLGETLRVNGRASISTDPELLNQFIVNGKLPKTVLLIQVETVFFQCSRAIHRSGLWSDKKDRMVSIPTPGRILADLSNSTIDGDKYDRELPARIKETLY